jgi:hypothetical protein
LLLLLLPVGKFGINISNLLPNLPPLLPLQFMQIENMENDASNKTK